MPRSGLEPIQDLKPSFDERCGANVMSITPLLHEDQHLGELINNSFCLIPELNALGWT